VPALAEAAIRVEGEIGKVFVERDDIDFIVRKKLIDGIDGQSLRKHDHKA
jgi:hypothetical protein